MALEGISSNLTAEQIIDLFGRKPLWDRSEFRKSHFFSYLSDPGQDGPAVIEAGMLHDQAVDAHESGDFGKAIELEEQAIGKFPPFAEAHLQISCEYFRLDRFEDALRVLDRMREFTQEEVPDFHFFRASSLLNLNQIDDALTEALKEVAIIGPDAEILALLSTIYQRKFVYLLEKQLGRQVPEKDLPRVGESWLVCLWRYFELQPDDDGEGKIAELSGHPTKKRLAELGIPGTRCGMCGFPTKLEGAVPLGVKMGLWEDALAFVCGRCVERRSIPVDRTYPVQPKIILKGQKFLQYGNVFVNV